MTTFQKLTAEIKTVKKELASAVRDVRYAEEHEEKCRKELRELEASLKAASNELDHEIATRMIDREEELKLSWVEIDILRRVEAGLPAEFCQGAESVRAIALHHGVL